MPKIRSAEFCDFINNGKPRYFGSLSMQGNTVYSYDQKIADIFRDDKLIYISVAKFSKTTTTHQNAILNSGIEDQGWKIIQCQNKF